MHIEQIQAIVLSASRDGSRPWHFEVRSEADGCLMSGALKEQDLNAFGKPVVGDRVELQHRFKTRRSNHPFEALIVSRNGIQGPSRDPVQL